MTVDDEKKTTDTNPKNSSQLRPLNIVLGALVLILGGVIVAMLNPGESTHDGYVSFVCRLPNQKPAVELRLPNNGLLIVEPSSPILLTLDMFVPPEGLSDINVDTPNSWMAHGGKMGTAGNRAFEMVAPKEAGSYDFSVSYRFGEKKGRDVFDVVVMVNAKEVYAKYPKTYAYPLTKGRNVPGHVKSNVSAYEPPRFLFEMDEQIAKRQILPGYTLGEFVAKASPDAFAYNQHAYLDVKMIDKLRQLTIALIERRYINEKLQIISGFRTPSYNLDSSVGGSAYSRHIYGDAVSFIIDEDGDGFMDDLNRDGKIDREDGVLVAKEILALETAGYVSLGGIGVLEDADKNPHNITIHLDTRGFSSRWGFIREQGKLRGFVWYK